MALFFVIYNILPSDNSCYICNMEAIGELFIFLVCNILGSTTRIFFFRLIGRKDIAKRILDNGDTNELPDMIVGIAVLAALIYLGYKIISSF